MGIEDQLTEALVERCEMEESGARALSENIFPTDPDIEGIVNQWIEKDHLHDIDPIEGVCPDELLERGFSLPETLELIKRLRDDPWAAKSYIQSHPDGHSLDD